MIDVELPAGSEPAAVRSLAACLAAAAELPVTNVLSAVEGAGSLPEAVARWRSWLAGRGSGLVPVADPQRFAWAGYWLAQLDDGSDASDDGVAVLAFGTPPGVVLAPTDPSLLGRALADLPVRAGWVLAAMDPRVAAPPAAPAELRGRVEALLLASSAEELPVSVASAQALAGRGLRGDRYADAAGTFSPRSGRGRRGGYDLTLVTAEDLDDAGVDWAGARRNVVVSGVDLDALIGRRFRLGGVECLGVRRCEPCAHLERLTAPGVLRGLLHRGGLRADVLSDGVVSVGDALSSAS